MPRKTPTAELLAENTAPVNSPLRRSTRLSLASANSPAPATIITRRSSHNDATSTPAKPVKARRTSTALENVVEDIASESKPTPRGKRAVVLIEDVDDVTENNTEVEENGVKPEKSSTLEKKSVSPEVNGVSELKKAPVRGRRRSTSSNESEIDVKPKSVRSRRNSSTDNKEDPPEKQKLVKSRRSSVNDRSPSLEPEKRVTRARRSSVTKEIEEAPASSTPLKRTRRGRRTSTDSQDTDNAEPQDRKLKGRRLSVTENVITLDPINEVETEKDTKTFTHVSPPRLSSEEPGGTNKSQEREVNTSANQSQIQKKTDCIDLNLSVINESFSDENQPKMSPKLNRDASDVNNFSNTKSPLKLHGNNLSHNETNDCSKSSQMEDVIEVNGKKVAIMSYGSDDSFKIQLNSSLTNTTRENEGVLETSKSSDTSDKENISSASNVAENQVNITENIQQSEKSVETTTNTAVARVSNVFRPKMIELSFSEPMEIDECSATINKSVFDASTVKLHESVITVNDNTMNQSGSTTVKIEENTLNITQNTFIECDGLNTVSPTHKPKNDDENNEETRQVKSEVLENLDTLELKNNEPMRTEAVDSLDAKCDSKTTSPIKDVNRKSVSPNIALRRSGRLSKGLENSEDVSPTLTSRSPKSTKNSVSPSVSKEITVAEQKTMITESGNSSPDRLNNLPKIHPTSNNLDASSRTRNLEKSMDYEFSIPTDEDEDDVFVEKPSSEHISESNVHSNKDTKYSPNKRRSSSPDVKESKKPRCSPQKSKQLNVSNDKSNINLSKCLEDKQFLSETTDDENQNMEITKQDTLNCSSLGPRDRDPNSDLSSSCNISFKKPKESSPGKIPEEVLFNCDTTTDSDISFRPKDLRNTNEQFEMQETLHCSISETTENTSLKSMTQELSNISKSRFSLTENNSKVGDYEPNNQSNKSHKSDSDSFESNSSNKENLQSDKSADKTQFDLSLNSEYSPKTKCMSKNYEDVKNNKTDSPADKEEPQEETFPVKHKKKQIGDDSSNLPNDIVECHDTKETDSRIHSPEIYVKSAVKHGDNDSDSDKSKVFDGTSDNDLNKSNSSSSVKNFVENDKRTKLKMRENKEKSTSSSNDTTGSLKVKKSRSKNKKSSYCDNMQEESAKTSKSEDPSKSDKAHSAESCSDTDGETHNVDTRSKIQDKSLIHSSNSDECLDVKSKKKKKSKKKRDKKPDKDVLNLSNELDDLDLSCDKVNNRLSLEEFANSKMDAYLSEKIKELEEDSDSTDSCREDMKNEFIDDMAEEGEEDTPSEGSNDIVDHGESVGSSDSEIEEEEEEYEEDSFICDDEVTNLLSGEEYYLEQETKNEEQAKEGKQRKRIIAPSDSSDDECEKQNNLTKEKETIILDDDKCHNDLSEASDLQTNNSFDRASEATNPVKRCSLPLGINESVSVKDIDDKEEEESNKDNVGSGETELPTTNSTEVAVEIKKSVKRRSSSLNIHESIPIRDIKDKGKDVGEMISQFVDSFVSNRKHGEISLNVSIEAIDDDEELVPCLDSERKPLEISNRKINNSSDSSSDNSINNRLSMSLNQLDIHNEIKPDKPHDSSLTTKKLNGSMKKKAKKHKKRGTSVRKIEKPSTTSVDDLRTETFNLMSQLITDVRNRPKRINKPSTSMESSWIAEEVKTVKPSTTTVPAKEKQKMIIHARDFKNQMLYDPSRIRRIDTKSLLKKKSA